MYARSDGMVNLIMRDLSPVRPSKNFAFCSGLLSVLFAYSAVVQLNDNDWYIWLPFYTLASIVCFAHAIQFSTVCRLFAYVGLLCGSLLFIKVVSEGCFTGKAFSWMEFLSLDMEHRLVREKLGSLLVCLSLWFQLEMSRGALNKSGSSQDSLHKGMFLLLSASIYLCATYFAGRGGNGQQKAGT